MEELEMTCFEMISAVGSARSSYIEAIHAAKVGDYDKANQLIEEGNDSFLEGHKVHLQLIQNEASGKKNEMSLLLVHSEDQLMSAEGFKILALELIDIYKRIS